MENYEKLPGAKKLDVYFLLIICRFLKLERNFKLM